MILRFESITSRVFQAMTFYTDKLIYPIFPIRIAEIWCYHIFVQAFNVWDCGKDQSL